MPADQACYAFQVADYAKRFTCYTVDLRGAGLSGKPDGVYTTELFAADIAEFMRTARRVHLDPVRRAAHRGHQ
jgi:pimeloyl-ACP methyl ester carboxylesterase